MSQKNKSELYQGLSETADKLAVIIEWWLNHGREIITPFVAQDFPYTGHFELPELTKAELAELVADCGGRLPILHVIYYFEEAARQWIDNGFDANAIPVVTLSRDLVARLQSLSRLFAHRAALELEKEENNKTEGE